MATTIDFQAMNADELEILIQSQPGNRYAGIYEIADWGSSRGQGKRSGGKRVKGSMSNARSGVVAYRCLLAHLPERNDLKPSLWNGIQIVRYAKARSAGLPPELASIYANNTALAVMIALAGGLNTQDVQP